MVCEDIGKQYNTKIEMYSNEYKSEIETRASGRYHAQQNINDIRCK